MWRKYCVQSLCTLCAYAHTFPTQSLNPVKKITSQNLRPQIHEWIDSNLDFFGCSTPSERGVLVHNDSLASCQWCRHSVESRALTCPFKESNLSAWSLLRWHPTHTYLWGRLYFVQVCCLFCTVTVTPSHDSDYTEALLLNGFDWDPQRRFCNQTPGCMCTQHSSTLLRP